MAKELYHKHSKNVARNKPMTHAEWSSTTAHRIDGAVAGDLIYMESSTGGFVGLGIGTSGQFLTVSSSGLPEWSSTITTDRIFEDDIDIELGTGSDALLRFSTADSDNHVMVIGLDDTSQSLHITDKGAIATDWNLSANTHPTMYIHSNTTPATDFLRIGAHDGTNAYVDIVGGTTLHLQVGGADQLTLTASAADFQDNTITTTATITTTSTIELGHATDTTLTRSGSGDVTIEGNQIYRAGGTDVAVADGGTGASTLLANAVLTGNGTSAIQAETALLFDSNKLIPTASAHDAAGTALTVSAGSTTAGTSNNQAGAHLTLQGGQGKGSGAGGNIVFQTANAATSGSSLNALATALTISDDLSSTFAGEVVFGSDGSGVDVSFHSATSGDLMLWDASEEQLKITGTDGAVALDVADGNVKIVDSLYFYDVGGEHISSNGSLLTVTGITKFASTVYVNDSANGDVTLGLTLNQAANTDKILAFKGSGVNHGRTGRGETDTYANFMQASGNFGGLLLDSIAEDGANDLVTIIRSSGGTASTGKNTSAYGLVDFQIEEHDGSNAAADIASDGNIFTIRAYVSSGLRTRFLVDEDGSLYAAAAGHTGDHAVGSLDEYEDAHLIRAFEKARDAKGLLRDQWDDFVRYNEDDLVNTGVLGDYLENGGLLNMTGLMHLHSGAIWQGYKERKQLEEKVTRLEGKIALLEGAA
jgi:hypothetical protein